MAKRRPKPPKRYNNKYQFYRLYVFEPNRLTPLKLEELASKFPQLFDFFERHGRPEYDQRSKTWKVRRAFNAVYFMELSTILDNTPIADRPWWAEIRTPVGRREKRWSHITSWNSDLLARIEQLIFPVEDWEHYDTTTTQQAEGERAEQFALYRVNQHRGRPSRLRKSSINNDNNNNSDATS